MLPVLGAESGGTLQHLQKEKDESVFSGLQTARESPSLCTDELSACVTEASSSAEG